MQAGRMQVFPTTMRRIAVLKGGLSRERAVSLASGAACAAALRQAGFEAIEVDVGRDVAARLQAIAPDACFNALHGPLGEDGSIQGLLNILGIPYTHSGVAASSLAMDKARTKSLVQPLGIPVPQGRRIGRAEFWAAPPPAPFVLKPVGDGSSIDIFVVRGPAALPFAPGHWPFPGEALLEDFVAGKELTVTVLDDRPLAVTEIVLPDRRPGGFFDFAAKYTPNGARHVLPAGIARPIHDRCLDQALAVHRALGCRGLSRSDFILCERTGEPVFLEINTQPGMTPTSLAPEQALHAGIGFPALVTRLVALATVD